jgi:hypothetical protein
MTGSFGESSFPIGPRVAIRNIRDFTYFHSQLIVYDPGALIIDDSVRLKPAASTAG